MPAAERFDRCVGKVGIARRDRLQSLDEPVFPDAAFDCHGRTNSTFTLPPAKWKLTKDNNRRLYEASWISLHPTRVPVRPGNTPSGIRADACETTTALRTACNNSIARSCASPPNRLAAGRQDGAMPSVAVRAAHSQDRQRKVLPRKANAGCAAASGLKRLETSN